VSRSPTGGAGAARANAYSPAWPADRPWIGIAEFIRILAMPPEMPGVPARPARRVADEIQPRIGDPRVRWAYGMLHLHAALRAAVDGHAIEARGHLGDARGAATSLGEPEDDLGLARFAFGPTNVGFRTVSIELGLSEPRRALEAAKGIRPALIPPANRQAPYHADVGTAGRDRPRRRGRRRVPAVRGRRSAVVPAPPDGPRHDPVDHRSDPSPRGEQADAARGGRGESPALLGPAEEAFDRFLRWTRDA
jgi:hypothetical protein